MEKLINMHLSAVLPKDERQRWPVFFSNAVLHGPLQMDTPPDQAFTRCASVNHRLIQILHPSLVVAMGNPARDSIVNILGLQPIQKDSFMHGQEPTHLADSQYVFWTPHPASRGMDDILNERFNSIRRHLESHP
jgi:uracil-DNA glycosylase